MGERDVCTVEVVGSNPIGSTITVMKPRLTAGTLHQTHKQTPIPKGPPMARLLALALLVIPVRG